MVCRDANTRGAHKVNVLIVSTPEERALYAIGKRMSNLAYRYAYMFIKDSMHRYERKKTMSCPSLPLACASYF